MTPLCADLSPREEQVLGMIARGLGMREIAESMGITEATARWHRANVLRKLDARNQAHAVALYAGLVAGVPA